jgi:hypothetical protein
MFGDLFLLKCCCLQITKMQGCCFIFPQLRLLTLHCLVRWHLTHKAIVHFLCSKARLLVSLTITSNNRASGGELLDNLTKQTHISETDIAGYIRQVLWGLDHMHIQNIAHLGLTVSGCTEII